MLEGSGGTVENEKKRVFFQEISCGKTTLKKRKYVADIKRTNTKKVTQKKSAHNSSVRDVVMFVSCSAAGYS